MTRRARWHDYHSRSLYMITLRKAAGAPDFSRVGWSPSGLAQSIALPAGKVIQRFLTSIFRFHPALKCWKYVIMPDHVHFILFVSERVPSPMREYVYQFMDACDEAAGFRMFDSDFHDRIVRSEGLVSRLKQYIEDNPRRLMVKREHPDFFSRQHRVIIDGEEFCAVGNLFLLDDCDLVAVRVSSKYSPEELRARKRLWLDVIDHGGVLVSPFISDAERRVREYALENGGKIINIIKDGFSPLYKPAGRFFDLCAEGRLLLLGPVVYSTRKTPLTREAALHFNGLAEAIAEGKASVRF